jgi:hypothetical protein
MRSLKRSPRNGRVLKALCAEGHWYCVCAQNIKYKKVKKEFKKSKTGITSSIFRVERAVWFVLHLNSIRKRMPKCGGMAVRSRWELKNMASYLVLVVGSS